MPPICYRGLLGDKWRIIIDETTTGDWRASLLGDGAQPADLGTFSNALEAKRSSERTARDLIVSRGSEDPGPVSDWRRVPNIRVLDTSTGLSRIWSIGSTVIGAMALGIAANLFLASFPKTANTDAAAIASLRTDLTAVQKKLDALGTQTTQPTASISALQFEVGAIKEKLAAVDLVIGDDPMKRLTVPMLRRDLDVLRDQQKSDVAVLRDEITRASDMFKWLLGILGLGSLLTGISGWLPKLSSSKLGTPSTPPE